MQQRRWEIPPAFLLLTRLLLTTAGLRAGPGCDPPASPHQYVYGQVRKGGTTTFIEATGTENKYLHIVVAMAGHEVEEIGAIYIDDEIVTIDGSGFVTSAPWNSKVRIKKHLGSATQAADSDLVAETSVTSTFQGKGIAYIYARLDYDTDVFANGVPVFTAMVKGKKVYDPRTSTTAYSNNSALCVRDYLTSEYGLGDDAIDDTVLSASATRKWHRPGRVRSLPSSTRRRAPGRARCICCWQDRRPWPGPQGYAVRRIQRSARSSER